VGPRRRPFRPRLLPHGESGLLVALGEEIDPEVNGRVHRLARAAAAVGGVREVVPGYCSLLVVFDPLRLARARLARRLRALLRRIGPGADPPARTVSIPVCYGGEHGPDLAFVAERAGLSPEEAAALHASASYRVHLLGFTPGFPYLAGLPPRLAAPRLESPRLAVPPGSVAIGGAQTGIYSLRSPGGWRIVGRTPLRLFDPSSPRPFLLAAGDGVRFEPVGPERFGALAAEVAAGGPAAGGGA
jgi:KipI family sensor histidine kinase inhibitor